MHRMHTKQLLLAYAVLARSRYCSNAMKATYIRIARSRYENVEKVARCDTVKLQQSMLLYDWRNCVVIEYFLTSAACVVQVFG